MRRAAFLVAMIMVMAVSVATLSAQWPKQPTPGVPRTASGEPDMNGPVPKTADGKPDLSGVWRGGAGGRQGAAAPPPGGPPVAGFRDVAQNIKGGLPLTPYGAELLKTRVAGNSKDNPEAHCLPMGIIQLHTQGAPRKFFQMPRSLVIYEASWERREIFTDGRRLPPDDVHPWYYGYSVGRWDGDTLVVETAGFGTAAGSTSSAARSPTLARSPNGSAARATGEWRLT